jgi:hypothetical protein
LESQKYSQKDPWAERAAGKQADEFRPLEVPEGGRPLVVPEGGAPLRVEERPEPVAELAS